MITNRTLAGLSLIFIGVSLLWVGSVWSRLPRPIADHPATATPQWRGEPIVPTAPPAPERAAPAATAAPTEPPAWMYPEPALYRPRERFGLGIPWPPLPAEAAHELNLGWTMAWRVIEQPEPAGLEFWQTIRLREDGFWPDEATIKRAAQANPGATWVIGNEPDVKWQDNVTPTAYAEWYHHLYSRLKAVDPTSQVAIGAITQPSPLRRQYLEAVLAAYHDRFGQAMPIDVWNIHNFILREERDNWGVDIPPGLDADHGLLLTIDDHDDIERFKSQLIDFRRWMAAHGYRDKPLVVTEYGILMPESYGFGPDRVSAFMLQTYEFMLAATDPAIGYPADGHRLVQRWAWFSAADKDYPTGNLLEVDSNRLTPLGVRHRDYTSKLP